MGDLQVAYMCCNCFCEIGEKGFILSCGEFVCNSCIDYIKIHKNCPSCTKTVNFISLEDSDSIPEEVRESIIDITDVIENMYKTMKFQNDYYKKMVKQLLKVSSKLQSEITEYKRVIVTLENQLNFSNNNSSINNNTRGIVGISTKAPTFLKDTDLNTSQSPFKRQRGESLDMSNTRNQYHNVSPTPPVINNLTASNEERIGSLKFGNTMLPPPIRSSKILSGSSKIEHIQERPISARSDTSHSNINKPTSEMQLKSEPIRRSDQSLSSNPQYQYQSQELGHRQRPSTTGTQSVPDRVRSPLIRTANITSRTTSNVYSDANRSIPVYTPNKNWSRPSS